MSDFGVLCDVCGSLASLVVVVVVVVYTITINHFVSANFFTVHQVCSKLHSSA